MDKLYILAKKIMHQKLLTQNKQSKPVNMNHIERDAVLSELFDFKMKKVFVFQITTKNQACCKKAISS